MGGDGGSAAFFLAARSFVLQKDSGKNSSDYRVAALTPSVKTTL
jgi:hypothetical protein